jgi:hypothetical protein
MGAAILRGEDLHILQSEMAGGIAEHVPSASSSRLSMVASLAGTCAGVLATPGVM